jgi:hypothetical protein
MASLPPKASRAAHPALSDFSHSSGRKPGCAKVLQTIPAEFHFHRSAFRRWPTAGDAVELAARDAAGSLPVVQRQTAQHQVIVIRACNRNDLMRRLGNGLSSAHIQTSLRLSPLIVVCKGRTRSPRHRIFQLSRNQMRWPGH